jgi:hypothetical protein
VVCIKNYIKILIIFLAIAILSNICVSAQNQAELKFIDEPIYKLKKEITKGGTVIGWTYQIDIKIQNSGGITSKQTLVNITDEEGFTLQNITTFEPGETKTVSFTWSTLSSYDQTIHISYYPQDLSINHDQYNSGSTSFKLLVGEKDEIPAASTNTPGFEIIVSITAIAITILLINKKKK